MTLSSGDEFILSCSSENIYTCSGSNVNYSFDFSNNSLMVNDTSVSLTKNGNIYTGTNDSITYTIIPYEETTTNI